MRLNCGLNGSMVRKYKRKTITTYTEADLENAIAAVQTRQCGIKESSRKNKVPFTTLHREISALKNNKSQKPRGGQTVLSEEFETRLLKSLDSLTDWKVPFDCYDIRCFVKAYHDKANISLSKFVNNFPGYDWVQSFVKRHKLTKRITDNVKAAKAEVNREIMNMYFDRIEKWLHRLPPERIYNYDETYFSDNPGAKTVVCRRGRRRVERKVNHSKSCISVMFCGNAHGELLPPMVVYKALHCYEGWTKGGPHNTVYDTTKSGWFDTKTFETWFFKQFLPSTDHQRNDFIALIEKYSYVGCYIW